MKKLIFILTSFIIVVLAGCAEFGSILSSLTIPVATASQTTMEPTTNSTTTSNTTTTVEGTISSSFNDDSYITIDEIEKLFPLQIENVEKQLFFSVALHQDQSVTLFSESADFSIERDYTGVNKYYIHLKEFDFSEIYVTCMLDYNGETYTIANKVVKVNYEVEDLNYISINEAKGKLNEEVSILGTVSSVGPLNGGYFRAFFNDNEEGILMYKIPEEYYEKIEVGNVYLVTGTIICYRGQYEINEYKEIRQIYSSSGYIPKVKTIEYIGDYISELDKIQNMPVEIVTPLTIVSKYNTSTYIVKDGKGVEISLYVNKNYTSADSYLQELLSNSIGCEIEYLTGYINIYDDMPQVVVVDDSSVQVNYDIVQHTKAKYIELMNNLVIESDYSKENYVKAVEIINEYVEQIINSESEEGIIYLYEEACLRISEIPTLKDECINNSNYLSSVSIDTLNCDALGDAVAIWTEGYIRDYNNQFSAWIGNNWRYYIVVDNMGRICYAVVFPETGYGQPNDYNSYYCDPYYSDYTQNPAFEILDGFGPWEPNTTNFRLFNVKVPEGGFALTAHGTAADALVKILTDGKAFSYEDTNTLNTTKPYIEGLLLDYDFNSNQLNIYQNNLYKEPDEIHTSVNELILNPPLETKKNIYIVDGIWKNREGYTSTANKDGRGYLYNENNEFIEVYTMGSSKDECITYELGNYRYKNQYNVFPNLNITDGTIVRLGMLYDATYGNYYAYFIEILGQTEIEEDEKVSHDKNLEVVESVEQLTDGCQILLTFRYNVMGVNTGKYFSSIETACVSIVEGAQLLTLVKNGDYWYLKTDDTNYVYTDGKGNYIYCGEVNDESAQWTINIIDGKTEIVNVLYPERLIQYNEKNPRFSCYKNTLVNPTAYIVKSAQIESKVHVLNISDLEVGDITGTKLVGSIFKINASDNKKMSVEENYKTGSGEISFTKRLKYNGKTSSSGERTISFTVDGYSIVTVYVMSGSNDDPSRTISLCNENLITLDSQLCQVASSDLCAVTFEVEEAGTYHLAAYLGAINVYYVSVETFK